MAGGAHPLNPWKAMIGRASSAHLAELAICCIFFYLSTRYANWNFDDLNFYSSIQANIWGEGTKATYDAVFLASDLPQEYRTYSLARVLEFGLIKLWGDRPFLFFAFMALTHIVSAVFIYSIVKNSNQPSRQRSCEAFGCAVIWLFSPFSITSTFHHFSYILLPCAFLLAFIWVFELDPRTTRRGWRALILVVLLVATCLTGEAMIPPLITYLAIKMVHHASRRAAVGYCCLTFAVLLSHYMLLQSARPKLEGARFVFNVPTIGKLVADCQYFASSVLSAIKQGLHFTAVSFDPYYPGLLVHSFVWQNISLRLIAAVLVMMMLCGLAVRRRRRSQPLQSEFGMRSSGRRGFITAMIAVIVASWSLYLLMTFSGARLYNTSFALQIRYGYVVLPASAIAIFLLWRRLPKIAGQSLSSAAWTIPAIAIVSWLGAQLVSRPIGAHEDRRTVEMLKAATLQDVRLVSVAQPPDVENNKIRPLGLLNPFVRWGDSAFQQDWTTASYLYSFLNLKYGSYPFIKWDDNFALILNQYGAALEALDKKFVVAGSHSAAMPLAAYPVDDLVLHSPELIANWLVSEQIELLDRPVTAGSDLRLQRILRFGPRGKAKTFVFAWDDAASNDVVFIHFLDASGKSLLDADYAFRSGLQLKDNSRTPSLLRLRTVEVPESVASQVTRIGIGAYAVDRDGKRLLRAIHGGIQDRNGTRVLVPNPLEK